MIKTYEEIKEELIEGTPEYDEFRKNHIGGSDIGTIMGVNPYKTPFMLWLEKIGAIEPEKPTEAMIRGNAMESEARDLYIQKTGTSLLIKRFEYKPWPVLIASVDGISLDYKTLYEAKCPFTSKLMDEAINNKIPERYAAQIQQYLMIINDAEICDYHVHINENENLILNVYPDKDFHKEIIKKAKEFWYMVENKIQPERKEGDPYYIMDTEINNKALIYRDLKIKEKEIQLLLKEQEEVLKEFVVDKKVIFGTTGLKATICEGRTMVDWKKVTEDLNLNEELLNTYRKKSSAYILYKV